MSVSETPQKSVDQLVKFYGELYDKERDEASSGASTNTGFSLRSSEGATTSRGASTSGEMFLREYYECLSNDLDNLVEFYDEEAVLTLQYDDEGEEVSSKVVGVFDTTDDEEDGGGKRRTGEGKEGKVSFPLSPIGREIRRQPIVEGKEAIGERLRLIYQGRRATISSIDCQMSSRGTMLLVASGTLDPKPSATVDVEALYGYDSAPFVQSFIVTCVEGEDLKITNDILRRSEPKILGQVPQLDSKIGTPVIGRPKGLGLNSEEPAGGSESVAGVGTGGSTTALEGSYTTPLTNQSAVRYSGKSKSKSTSSSSRKLSSSSRKRRKERTRRPTPKRLFQPVSLTEKIKGGGEATGTGNNLAALMTFIASLCEILVNSVWSAVAILHVVGTLSLLLSVSAMFLKSRNDLFALEQKAKEIEQGVAEAAVVGDFGPSAVKNLASGTFLQASKMKAESGHHRRPHFEGGNLDQWSSNSNSLDYLNVKVNTDEVLGSSKSGAAYSSTGLLNSLQNGEYDLVKGGGGLPPFKDE
ncbi:NTF2 domain-containing protein [Chloropicon primus]|uniref:NTF2 domain-containing protein n=1 Tax=Chloropicon primus TaxID=1764295 RepID=A0A5B8MM80_9CHLO|nr:hypothetical protein A3770_06p40770 [Chloropicon primus]UPR00770.1 NTF2 domain-containing protein [Chloropicon primus]|eukprot:QDZ21559.1 hypothetical protein A3770_06p40770 [Chloropicon primus]